MGWANCGKDSRGRNIGYGFSATCDEPGCKVRIDRGLAYVCGGFHGGDTYGCGEYFCEVHRLVVLPEGEERAVELCKRCADQVKEAEEEEADYIANHFSSTKDSVSQKSDNVNATRGKPSP